MACCVSPHWLAWLAVGKPCLVLLLQRFFIYLLALMIHELELIGWAGGILSTTATARRHWRRKVRPPVRAIEGTTGYFSADCCKRMRLNANQSFSSSWLSCSMPSHSLTGIGRANK